MDDPVSRPPYGPVARLTVGCSALGLLFCVASIGLLAVSIFDRGNDPSHLTALQRAAFSGMTVGMTGFVVGMCVVGTLRAPRLVGKLVAVAFLWLPLGLPVLAGAVVGLWAIWVWAP